jgi:hypothetical protein
MSVHILDRQRQRPYTHTRTHARTHTLATEIPFLANVCAYIRQSETESCANTGQTTTALTHARTHTLLQITIEDHTVLRILEVERIRAEENERKMRKVGGVESEGRENKTWRCYSAVSSGLMNSAIQSIHLAGTINPPVTQSTVYATRTTHVSS